MFQSKRKFVKLAVLTCAISFVAACVVVTTVTLVPPPNSLSQPPLRRTGPQLGQKPRNAPLVPESLNNYILRDINSTADVVFVPSTPQFSKFLVVFFAGTAALPADYKTVLSHLATANNHRVIGLPYNNGVSAFVYCRDLSSTSGCYGTVKENQVFGKTSDNLANIVQKGYRSTDPDLAVVNRLKKVLVELQEKYPQDKWSDFLHANSDSNEIGIAWGKVLAMGHSQGAAIAAYLGSQLRVAGVRQFAGPSDVYSDGVVAAYLTNPSATAKSLWRTFRNRYDMFCDAVTSITTALNYQDYGSSIDIALPLSSELKHNTNNFCSNSCLDTVPKERMPMTAHSNFIQDIWLNGENRTWCFDYKLLWEEFGKVEECDQINCVGDFYCNPVLGCIKKETIYRNETLEGCRCQKL